MADLEHAAAYVREHGSPVDVARIAALLGIAGSGPSARAAVEVLSAETGAQGGYAASWSADGESVDATCSRMEALRDLGPAAADLRGRALLFLSGRQSVDGAVTEPELSGPLAPEWADPGSARSVTYLTAHAGFWLATAPVHRPTAAAAGRYLADRMDVLTGTESYVASLWLAAGVLSATSYAEAADELVRLLAAVVEDLGPDSLAWLANTLPTADVANAARFRLTWRQEPDGRWASEQGPEHDVAVTVAAVRALRAGGPAS